MYMANNTYKNATGGIPVLITGTNTSAFINAINSANIYGITSNISLGNINIIAAVPGPFYLSETDSVNTPLAKAGIAAQEYGVGSNLTIISGTIPNAAFNANSFFGIGINWNAILNQLPQNQRGIFKCIHIASPERQTIGSNGYRPLNIYAGTHSPVQGHPWQKSYSSYAFTDSVTGSAYSINMINGVLTSEVISSANDDIFNLVFADTQTSDFWAISVMFGTFTVNKIENPGFSILSLILVDSITATLYKIIVSNGTFETIQL